MRPFGLAVCLLAVLAAQADEGSQAPEGFAERPAEHQGLVDEDEEFAPPPQEYAFNPVQARKELKVGIHYSKKSSHRAAAARYLEATRWNPSYAEAFFRLAATREKLGLAAAAILAYERYLELEPDGRRARQARERLQQLRASAEARPAIGIGNHPEGSL